MSKDFSTIEAGDKLLQKGRTFKSGIHRMTEWKEFTVESTTKVFYVVDGEKFRKEHNGKHFLKNFYFPGQEGAPENPTPEGEFDDFMEKMRQIQGLDLIRTGIHSIPDLDKACDIALKLKQILAEVEDAKIN